MTTIKTNSNCNALPVSSLESKHCIFESIILNRKRKESNTRTLLIWNWSGNFIVLLGTALESRCILNFKSERKASKCCAYAMPPIDLFKNYELCCIVLLGRLRRGSACNCNQSATVPYLALAGLSVCFEYMSSTVITSQSAISMRPMWERTFSNRTH